MLRGIVPYALAGMLALAPHLADAQAASAPTTPSPSIKPEYLADLKTPQTVVAALYQVISGPAGQARDWDRFRNLFAPGARMVALVRRPDGTTSRRVMTPEDYITGSGPFLTTEGFTEKELVQELEVFGGLAHIWTTYDGGVATGKMPPVRGINSVQLIQDGAHWRVLNIAWQSEQPGLSIPAEYLPK